MGRKLLAVVVIAAVGVGAYWLLGRGSDGPPDLTGLPPINVDESCGSCTSWATMKAPSSGT
jgi:hypothetical protein